MNKNMSKYQSLWYLLSFWGVNCYRNSHLNVKKMTGFKNEYPSIMSQKKPQNSLIALYDYFLIKWMVSGLKS